MQRLHDRQSGKARVIAVHGNIGYQPQRPQPRVGSLLFDRQPFDEVARISGAIKWPLAAEDPDRLA
jgi:hypothetical protein